MEMGLPVNKLICASNENNILTDFINTGIYDKKREFKKTISPSMDILISSNLERLLFELTNHNHEIVSKWMSRLSDIGEYSVDNNIKQKITEIFWAGSSIDDETKKTIDCIYKEYEYMIDTHTAVGIDVYDKYVISTGDVTKTVIVSTASPFKFGESVVSAILGEEEITGMSEFDLLHVLEDRFKLKMPNGLKNLDKKDILHNGVCSKDEMLEKVKSALNIK
jgi:threonine synthase